MNQFRLTGKEFLAPKDRFQVLTYILTTQPVMLVFPTQAIDILIHNVQLCI